MDDQTNRSYCNLIDPVLRSYFHEQPTVDSLEGNRECLIKACDGSQGAFLLQLNGGLVDITKLLCLVSLCLVLNHQPLSKRWKSDLLGLIVTCFHVLPSSLPVFIFLLCCSFLHSRLAHVLGSSSAASCHEKGFRAAMGTSALHCGERFESMASLWGGFEPRNEKRGNRTPLILPN